MEALAATFVGIAATAGPATVAGVAAVPGGLSAAGTAATAGLLGSGGVFGVGGTLTAFDMITGGFSAISAISDIASGQAGAAALEEGALFEEFGAKQEILKGRREALDILQTEQDLLEQNIVSTLASGITGQGSPKAAQQAIISKAAFETDITRSGAVIAAEARRAKGRQLKIEAGAAKTTGLTAAAGDVAGFFLRRGRRGKV